MGQYDMIKCNNTKVVNVAHTDKIMRIIKNNP